MSVMLRCVADQYIEKVVCELKETRVSLKPAQRSWALSLEARVLVSTSATSPSPPPKQHYSPPRE